MKTLFDAFKHYAGNSRILSKVAGQLLLRHIKASTGYQQFYYTKNNLMALDPSTRRKSDLLLGKLKDIVPNRTVLDIGCAQGYFSLLAALLGARIVRSIDYNKHYVLEGQRISRYMGLDSISFEIKSIYELDSIYKSDVVFALGIIHWFMDPVRRPEYHSFEEVMGFLDNVVRTQMFVEYILPGDATFTLWPPEEKIPLTDDGFSRQEFFSSLYRRFSSVEYLGNSRPTRELYLVTR